MSFPTPQTLLAHLEDRRGAHEASAIDVDGKPLTEYMLEDLAASSAFAGQYASKRPTVLLVGDSITAQNGRPSMVDVTDSYAARGFFNWANWLMGERYEVVEVRGVGGETATGLATRINTELANYDTDWVVVETGANSVTAGHTFATITADITTVLDAIQTDGRRCCLLTVWGSNSYTTLTMQQLAAEVSHWIATLPSTRRGLVIADAYSVLIDPSTGQLGSGMTYDTVHPGSGASYRVGAQVANAMRPFAPPAPNVRVADTDADKAIGNASFLSAGSGWTLNIGSGATYARDPDRFGNMATATVAAGGMEFAYLETLGTNINIGDVIQVRARIRWSGLTWSSTMTKFSPYIINAYRGSGGGFSSVASGQVGNEPSSFNTTLTSADVTANGDVIMTTPLATIPATASDASAIDRLYVKVGFLSTNLSGGTVTVSEVSCRKV